MNYRQRINLLKLAGAQVLDVTFPNGKTMTSIVIPAPYNDMIYTNRDGVQKVSPYINITTATVSDDKRRAKEAENAGREKYIAPTNWLRVSYGKDFRDKAAKAAEARLRRDKPQLTDDELKREVSIAVSPFCGEMTPFEDAEQFSVTASGTAVACATAQNRCQ